MTTRYILQSIPDKIIFKNDINLFIPNAISLVTLNTNYSALLLPYFIKHFTIKYYFFQHLCFNGLMHIIPLRISQAKNVLNEPRRAKLKNLRQYTYYNLYLVLT